MKEVDEEIVIGNLLRWGVLIAALIVGFGGCLYLIHYGKDMPNYSVFRGEPSDFTSLAGIFSGAASFHRRAIIQLGLVALIFTPVARVALLMILFLRRRDFLYAAITLVVFLMLIFSLTAG